MAVDRNKVKGFLEEIDDFLEAVPGSQETKKLIKRKVMGPAIEEIERLILDTRPPVILLFGRSGHGKSSLINALSDKKVLDTEEQVRPNTAEANKYKIDFPGKYSTWDVVDTRGIFESRQMDDKKAEDVLINAIRDYKPDVLMHVISVKEIRSFGPDRDFYQKMISQLKEEGLLTMPTIVCMTHVDTVNPKREWPLKSTSKKANTIIEYMNYLAKEVLKVNASKYDLNTELKGFTIEPSESNPYVGIFPLCTLWEKDEDDRWNIETLAEFIGEHLPEAAQLDFFQALGLRKQLQKISTNIIKTFSVIAAGIGAIPIPIADIAVLVPLQTLMISLIGGLSCRPLSMDTAKEYFVAAGANLAAGQAIKQGARQIIKMVPGFGQAVSATIASSGTYAIGKAAEFYFFSGDVVDPSTIKDNK